MKSLRTYTRLCIALAFALCLCLSVRALAQPELKLEHDSSWEIANRQCTIRVSQLANLGSADSGPLFLSIYARTGVGYDGVNSPGKLIARATIPPLAANSVVNDIVVTAKAKSASAREHYTTLTVEEQIGRNKFTILDYVVYTSTYTFPRGQSGGVGSDDFSIGSGDVIFKGDTSLAVTKRRAEFSIGEIQNQREITETGLLRLAIYATPAPYDGSAEPIVVATRTLGRLAQGDFYTHLQGRLNMKRPGRGVFYLTLAVEEDAGGGFERVAYVAFPDPRQF
ncbi:MAG TPA: hypothetical protein VK846_18490 [Candidatus Limnocylindria bacterium]|nr:hypothetical protein [Candidatus Limnocylindria bacterium]